MRIYQIETTSRCSLACGYCPHPAMRRTKEHMPIGVFERALDYPFAYDIVAAHHFGEPLLHPNVVEMARMCAERGLAFGFSSNLNVPRFETTMRRLVDNGLAWLKASFHNETSVERAAWIAKEFPDLPLLHEKLENKHSWAGQVEVEWTKAHDFTPGEVDCEFHHFDQCVVSAQGRLLACCLDAEGQSDFGSLFDHSPEEFAALSNDVVFPLCDSCPMCAPVASLVSSHEAYGATAEQVKARLRGLELGN